MTSPTAIAFVFFFYGLAFYSMGLAITLEIRQCSDVRLSNALRPLAGFGLLHGLHEWLEMFEILDVLPGQSIYTCFWCALRLAILALSFLSLAAFGAYLIVVDEQRQRYALLVPLGLLTVWSFGLLSMRNQFPYPELWDVADVWTRYTLAIPSAVIASVGLIVQQHEFRKAGLAQFGRDSLWAAVAFFWYGLVGQIFTRASLLPPSSVVNAGLFQELFGFPVQLLRAGTAMVASLFVIRFLRAFEVETKRQIVALQEAQLHEAQRREALRGEILGRIVAAQEAERQRIARELHDETGQALTAIGLGLRGASTMLRQDVDKAAHNLRQLEGLVTHSLDELQRLIADLRPSHLDDLGLAATLRWYTSELQNRTKLNIELEIHGDQQSLSSDIKTSLFRIIQEALTNVLKHAKAQTVLVSLVFNEKNIVAKITDDGIGFDSQRLGTQGRTPFGLVGMQERASLLDGEVNIQSRPGQGTRVEVRIPYPKEMEVEGS